MSPIIHFRKPEIVALCERFHVVKFYLFGSALNGELRDTSDLDFLVSFGDCTPSENADRYLGLLAALQDLFLTRIDLVEIEAIENPYFKREVELNRALLYAA